VASTGSKFDPMPPDKSSTGPTGAATAGYHSYSDQADVPTDYNGQPIDMLALIGRAEQISKDYQGKTIEQPLANAYRAWQNQHAQNSKYLGPDYKGRSRLFVPKTRSAVRKNMATAAAALFSTDDVVNITAAYDDDPRQAATAAVLKADLGYRMGAGVSSKVGMPWFMISMGGCQDSQLTGVVLSKQFWEYEAVPTKEVETVQAPLLDEETGEPVHTLDPMTGQPTPVMYAKQQLKMRVVKDRPMVDLLPIENALIDPAAPWYAPAQLGRWFCVKYPMGLSDARAMLHNPGKNGRDSGWIPVSDDLLLKGRLDDDRTGVRRAREGAGSDRFEDGRGTNELDIVWLQENFLRISGVDYTWWSVGRFGYISKVREVHEAYPELEGERPYVMGVAGIDTHRVFPMSPVHSWQPLQLELNDITNLRQDTLKRSIAPLTKVVRGKNVDRAALQRRGQPNAVIELEDMKDVEFEQTPGPTGASYTETSLNNSMFDELAGVFSTSSVQSNRQLNETVGGMKLMNGAANSVSEFDLRVWVETWIEPVIRQVMHLVRAFESDENVLALSGAKARVADKYNYLPGLSDFMATEISLRVNVGIGSLDPMQKLAKLKVALEMLAPAFPSMAADGIKPKYDALIEEIMGSAGYKDGRRFFEFGDPPEPKEDPEVTIALKEIETKNREIEIGLREALAEMRSEEKISAADNMTDIEVAQIHAHASLTGKLVDVEHDREERDHQAEREDVQLGHQSGEKDAERGFQREQKDADRAFQGEQKDADRGAKAEEGERKASEKGGGAKPKGKATPRDRIRGVLEKRVGGQLPQRPPQPEEPATDPRGFHANQQDTALAMSVEALGRIMDRLEAMAGRASANEHASRAIINHMSSPVELIHDEQGKLIGMKKGGQVRQIVRDGPDDRISGMQPVDHPSGPSGPPKPSPAGQ
jgi:hypothetical protein